MGFYFSALRGFNHGEHPGGIIHSSLGVAKCCVFKRREDIAVSAVYVALLIEALKNLLHAFNMVIIRGADKTVVGNVHKLPKILNSGNNFINKLLRGYALCLSLLLNFLSVLHSQTLGTVLHHILTIVSAPMIASGHWALSLFLWACLLMVSIRQLRRK